MTDKYAQLRAALDAGPTPGPWSACGSARYVHAGEGHPRHTILAVAYGHDGNHQINAPGSRENGQYIAAAHPKAIRALLAERDALREALRWAAGTLQSACCLAGPISEGSPFKLGDETRTVAQICDAADAALAQEQGGSNGSTV